MAAPCRSVSPIIAHLLSPIWSLAATGGRLLAVVVGLLFLPGFARADPAGSAEPGYVVHRWTVADGLPIDTLSAVTIKPSALPSKER